MWANIKIITPCSRPENLHIIASSLFDLRFPISCRFSWIICYDLSKVHEFNHIPEIVQMGIVGGVAGKAQINKALEYVFFDTDWVYVLDDDNIIHPNFVNLATHLHDDNIDIITFDQDLHDAIRLGNNPSVDYIDQAQFIMRKRVIEPYEQVYSADGIQIQRAVEKNRDRWKYIPETMCYYNYLR